MEISYKFFITTLGCKLNIYESEAISSDLVHHGWTQGECPDKADVIIVNTCTVTSKADAKCRNVIRKCRKSNPTAIIVVAGCLVSAYPEMIRSMSEVDILLDNKNKSKVFDAVSNYGKLHEPTVYQCGYDSRFDYKMDNLSSHSRAFIKIQDGCNNFCSYCKIPFARGTSVSRPIDDILAEIDKLADNGYREFVLTGVNIGMFHIGKDNFTTLLARLTSSFPECRFRVSSIEPMYIDDEFFAVFARPNVCAHLHIPLQSGSDKILSLMGRHYTCADFERLIASARMAKPNLFLSTDLIVGFPSEDEATWQEIYNFVKKLNFTFIHVFGFSPREGTKAFEFTHKTPERIRDERVNIITSLANQNTKAYTISNLGKTTSAIIERCHGDYYSARTDNYLDIRIPVSADLALKQKSLCQVKLSQIKNDILYGELV